MTVTEPAQTRATGRQAVYISHVERDRPMTTTIQQQAQETIQQNVLKYCQLLCEALRHDFQRQYDRDGYDFYIESGRKYHKIVMDGSGSRSVHCFVDKNTGEVYKSASWKAPAKGVRFDLRVIKEREFVLENCDWAGGYLYAK